MLLYFTSKIICSCAAFLYPGYASYKVLSQRPASEADLERWLMYWSVLGCIVGIEYVAEWVISWIPFYYLLKTLFLLYLSLPQTHGSTFLYVVYLQPFLHTHELQIDATIASLKARALEFIQQRLRYLWDYASSSIMQQQSTSFDPVTSAPANAPPPSMNDPVSGPLSMVSGLWRSYGPVAVASGAALLKQTVTAAQTSAAQAQARANALNASAAAQGSNRSGSSSMNRQSVIERRRQLEAELAALPPSSPPQGAHIPMPSMAGSVPAYTSSRTSSSSDLHLRERTSSVTGRFEEIEVPSDAEGYDVRDDDEASGEDRPPAGKRASSFFGWGFSGGSGSSKGGYERVKSE
jgi:receptor expression-enhancing protein 1/2/3/4